MQRQPWLRYPDDYGLDRPCSDRFGFCEVYGTAMRFDGICRAKREWLDNHKIMGNITAGFEGFYEA